MLILVSRIRTFIPIVLQIIKARAFLVAIAGISVLPTPWNRDAKSLLRDIAKYGKLTAENAHALLANTASIDIENRSLDDIREEAINLMSEKICCSCKTVGFGPWSRVLTIHIKTFDLLFQL